MFQDFSILSDFWQIDLKQVQSFRTYFYNYSSFRFGDTALDERGGIRDSNTIYSVWHALQPSYRRTIVLNFNWPTLHCVLQICFLFRPRYEFGIEKPPGKAPSPNEFPFHIVLLYKARNMTETNFIFSKNNLYVQNNVLAVFQAQH